MGSSVNFLIILVFLVLSSVLVSGQDLGSSNKLFGGKKPANNIPAVKRASAKKTPAKRKNTTAKVRVAAKRRTTAAKGAEAVQQPAKPVAKAVAAQPSKANSQAAKILPPPAAKIAAPVPKIITPAVKPPFVTAPISAATNELFENLIVEGNTARDDRNYAAAEAAYERAKKVKPTDSRSIYGLGNLYSDQQRWEDAEKAYRAALKLDPSSAIISVALSYVLSQPLMVPNLSDRYEEAEKLARRAIELAPSNALAFDQAGVAMELLGAISTEPESAYRNSIRLDPTFAPAYAHLGRLLRRRGELKEAAKAYENAVRLARDVATMIVVADVLQSEQRYAESEPLLRRAVANDPKNPAGLLLLGKALTALGNFSDAEKVLNRSLSVSTDGFLPSALLGSLYTRQGKYEMAENALMRAARSVSPGEKRNLSLRFEAVGDGYMKSGRGVNAARAYKQAIALDPENATLSGKLARSQHI
jgi:tetratricopeptide (TPR) repeat protein